MFIISLFDLYLKGVTDKLLPLLVVLVVENFTFLRLNILRDHMTIHEGVLRVLKACYRHILAQDIHAISFLQIRFNQVLLLIEAISFILIS